MMRATYSILVLFFLVNIYGVKSQLLSRGSCPNIAPLNPVRTQLLIGTWFENQRTPSINEHGLRCVSAAITFNTAFGVQYSARTKISNTRVNLNGNAVFIAGVNVGTLQLTFRDNRFPFVRTKPLTLTIIATDGAVNAAGTVTTPSTFVTLYSCRNLGLGLKIESTYILTATRVPTAATVAAALDSLTVRNLPTEKLQEVDQTNC